MSEDNAYTKLAQIVLGTFIEQVADLVRARINTSVSVNEEMIQGMVCEAFKHEFNAAMKDAVNRRIDIAIDGIDIEDMIERAIDREVSGKYIKNTINDSVKDKVGEQATEEEISDIILQVIKLKAEKVDDLIPEARIQEIIEDKVQLLMETGNVLHPIGTESLKQEIGVMNDQLGNMNVELSNLRGSIMDTNIKLQQLQNEIGINNPQLGNLEGQIAGLRRDMDKIVQACMSIGVSSL